MKYLKYNFSTIANVFDAEGNIIQQEIMTEAHVKDDESGRLLAEKEAIGEIVSYEREENENEKYFSDYDRISTLEDSLDILLSGVTSDE